IVGRRPLSDELLHSLSIREQIFVGGRSHLTRTMDEFLNAAPAPCSMARDVQPIGPLHFISNDRERAINAAIQMLFQVGNIRVVVAAGYFHTTGLKRGNASVEGLAGVRVDFQPAARI